MHGQVATLKCRQCKAPIEVDGRVRRGSAVNITTSAVAVPSIVHPAPETEASALPTSTPAKEAKPAPADATATVSKEKVRPAQSAPDLGGFSIKETGPIVARPQAGGHQAAKQGESQSTIGVRNFSVSGIVRSKSNTETERELSWAPPSEAQFANRKVPERSPTRPALPSNVSIKSVQDSPKPKPVAPRTEAKSSPRASEPGGQQDSVDLWVVSFDTEDDRELSTAQLLDAIAKGTVTRDNIVWREGMKDWLPIDHVPELAKSLKQEHAPKPQTAIKLDSVTAADDGDDETIIYRPGSKIIAAAKTSPLASASAQPAAKSTGANIARSETAHTEIKAEGGPRGTPPERSPRAVARSAPSLSGAASRTAAASPAAVAIS